jgi:hypothetical protein
MFGPLVLEKLGETGRNVSTSLIENMSFNVIWCCCVVIVVMISPVVFENKSGKLVGPMFTELP